MRTPRSLLLVCLLAPVLAAQPLSGNYTIDNSAPTAGSNYASFAEAAQALMAQGVNGPVLFTVVPGNGPYGGFQLGPLTGASAINTITFRGVGFPLLQGGVSVTTPGGAFNHTVHLYATSFTGIGSYLLGSGPQHITLEGLEVSNGLGTGYGAIVAMGCTNLTIRNCRVHDSDAAVSVAFSPYTVVEDCEIWNISPPAPASFDGHWAAVMVALQSDDSVVRRNRVHDCVHVGFYIGGQFNAQTGTPFTPSTNMVFVNNMIWGVTGWQTFPGLGAPNPWAVLTVYAAPGALIAHNSITVPSGYPGVDAAGMMFRTTAAPGTVANNVIQHQGNGTCIDLGCPPHAAPTSLDFNLYDPSPAASVGLLCGTSYPVIGAWQTATGQEASSLQAPAGFVSATDLHITYGSTANQIKGTPLAQVSTDIDSNPRDPQSPCRGADEFVLSLRGLQPGGPGSGLTLRNLSLIPGNEYYNIISLEPCIAGPGQGPYLGLCASPAGLQGLIAQLLLPVGAAPFHFNAAATVMDFGPYVAPPLILEGVSFDFSGGLIGSVSAVTRITIL